MSGDGSPTCMPDHVAFPDLDDIYDNLFDAMCNAVLGILGDAGSVKLKHPVEDYVHHCLQRMLNDAIPVGIVDVGEIREPVCNSDSQISCPPGEPAKGSQKTGPGSNMASSAKRKTLHEQTYAPQHSGKSGSKSPASQKKLGPRIQVGKKPRKNHSGDNYSCPFRKRNPQRFNVRDWSCALQPFWDLSLLKYEI